MWSLTEFHIADGEVILCTVVDVLQGGESAHTFSSVKPPALDFLPFFFFLTDEGASCLVESWGLSLDGAPAELKGPYKIERYSERITPLPTSSWEIESEDRSSPLKS